MDWLIFLPVIGARFCAAQAAQARPFDAVLPLIPILDRLTPEVIVKEIGAVKGALVLPLRHQRAPAERASNGLLQASVIQPVQVWRTGQQAVA